VIIWNDKDKHDNEILLKGHQFQNQDVDYDFGELVACLCLDETHFNCLLRDEKDDKDISDLFRCC